MRDAHDSAEHDRVITVNQRAVFEVIEKAACTHAYLLPEDAGEKFVAIFHPLSGKVAIRLQGRIELPNHRLIYLPRGEHLVEGLMSVHGGNAEFPGESMHAEVICYHHSFPNECERQNLTIRLRRRVLEAQRVRSYRLPENACRSRECGLFIG